MSIHPVWSLFLVGSILSETRQNRFIFVRQSNVQISCDLWLICYCVSCMHSAYAAYVPFYSFTEMPDSSCWVRQWLIWIKKGAVEPIINDHCVGNVYLLAWLWYNMIKSIKKHLNTQGANFIVIERELCCFGQTVFSETQLETVWVTTGGPDVVCDLHTWQYCVTFWAIKENVWKWFENYSKFNL